MITRAQAEALLTLAESLEACERQNITLEGAFEKITIHHVSGKLDFYEDFNEMAVRLAVNALIPKQET